MQLRKHINMAVLIISCLFLFYFSPDHVSMIFIGIMTVLILSGYYFCLGKSDQFAEGFQIATEKISDLKTISSSENWLFIKQIDSLFHNRFLDETFHKYIERVEQEKEEGKTVYSDIEDSISEDLLFLSCRKSIMDAIPGTLTGLGILGTFYGLISGLSNLHFSSADTVVSSITTLINGIDTAFYTSICGVILSILFELLCKLSWNELRKNLLAFYDQFHSMVIPDRQKFDRGSYDA